MRHCGFNFQVRDGMALNIQIGPLEGSLVVQSHPTHVG
jgi:hypothetical protein